MKTALKSLAKNFVRLALAVLAFAIEIKVKAEEVHHAPEPKVEAKVASEFAPTAVVFSPRGCWTQASSCNVLNDGHAAFPAEPNAAWRVAPKAFVERITESELRHFKGILWVKSALPFKIRTEFGEAEFTGQALLKKDRKEWQLWALEGDMTLTLRGIKQVVELPAGFTVNVGGITSFGSNLVSVPQVIQPGSIVKIWAQVHTGTIADLRATLHELKATWTEAVDVAADFQKSYIERAVADAEGARRREEAYRKEVERRNQEMLQLYKEKNFLDN